jgi:uncharacterized protein (DUF433 family)
VNSNVKVVFAFSVDHVARLTGLSKWQLAEWDRAGFFKPAHATDNRREPYSRIYSFQDVVGLRTLAMLRKVHKVPMWHLREVAVELETHVERPWSETTLYVLNRRVYFDEARTGNIREVSGGRQYALLPLESVANDMSKEVEKLRARSPEKIGTIERHRNVAHNAWVVAGTRIPVRAIREFASVGYTPEQIVREYPILTISDVKAALDRAAA